MHRKQFLHFCASALIASTLSPAFAATPLESTAEMRQSVVEIAASSLHAKLGGSKQDIERYVILIKMADGTTGVGGFGLVMDKDIDLPAGTVAVLRLRPFMPDQPPHGDDDRAVKAGVLVFIAVESGKIWEIANPAGVISIRTIDEKSVGAWEPFQADAGKYKVYQ